MGAGDGAARGAGREGASMTRATWRAHRGGPGGRDCTADVTFCGVAASAAILGDAWTLLLVRDLAGGPRRFKDLEAGAGISPRVLTDRLRTLVAQGILTRRM